MRRAWISLLCAFLVVPVAAVGEAASDAMTPSELEILALGPEAKRFLTERVPANVNSDDRFRALVDAMFGKDGLDITYGNTATRTAQETFDAGNGNCLSFTLLFVALAREVGLEASFHEVSEALSWDRRGDLVVINMHMFAEAEIDNGRNRVDFLPGKQKHYLLTRRIDDRRALAHYFNNLGVERLAAGELEAAEARLREAIAVDATFNPAWTNLGVALRRRGEFAAAEETYGQALEVAPADVTARWNLASLYLAVGRIEEGEKLVSEVEERRRRNPFYQFRQGMKALAQEDRKGAVDHLREAVRLLPDAYDFHEMLADAQLANGAPKRAASSLRRALALTTDDGERERLQARLAGLEWGTAWTPDPKN